MSITAKYLLCKFFLNQNDGQNGQLRSKCRGSSDGV